MSPDKYELLKNIMEEIIPFNRVLGLKMSSASEGKAEMRLDFKEELVGNVVTHILHGGVISATLDVVGACAVISTFDGPEPLIGMGTVDMRVDYLRPGSGEYFIATGEVMRPGRILASTRMELVDDQNKLVAIGTAIYRVSRKSEESPPNL